MIDEDSTVEERLGDARWEVICDRMEAEGRQRRHLRLGATGITVLVFCGFVPLALGRGIIAAVVWSIATLAGLVWLALSQRLMRRMRDTLKEIRAIAEEPAKRWHTICEGEKR